MPTIYTRLREDEIAALVARLPAILTGDAPDPHGIREGLQLRAGVAFLSLVKEAFLVKAQGGIDEAGISWPPLTKAYLAYGRGPKSSRRAGGKSPGGRDGFMSRDQLRQWRAIFSRVYLKTALENGTAAATEKTRRRKKKLVGPLDKAAAGKAAAAAWKAMKKRGVKTKLEVFGNRAHEILRDRGILFNSLSPGILVERSDGGAAYTLPAGQGGQQQRIDARPGELLIGTTVRYAAAHHNAKKPNRKRPLWPESLPPRWREAISRSAARGLQQAVEILVRDAEHNQ